MEEKWRKIFFFASIVILLFVIALLFILFNANNNNDNNKVIAAVKNTKKFKILHILSYHMNWQWTEDQFKGFKDALTDLDVEYKIFEMDTKNNSSAEWIKKVSKEAKDLIDTWKPDLVYTNDDNVQEYVVRYYVNKDIPFVFSGVNADPAKYGFVGSKNITGVLEYEHFFQSVKLLKEIIPGVTKIAVIIDDDPAWLTVINRCKESAQKELPEIKFISWDFIKTFAEYKAKIKEYEKTADALCIISWFTFKDEKGKNVTELEVGRWTAENSRLPDFAFWQDRVAKGTLCSVYVSAYEQGHAAGKMAYRILADNISPDFFPIQPTIKGKPVISLRRAKVLNIKIKSSILLDSEVLEKYLWEEQN